MTTLNTRNKRKIAKMFMKHIQYDNGCVNRFEDETYPEEWVGKIAEALIDFCLYNPDLLDEDVIEEIAIGSETGEMRKKYSVLRGFKKLDEVLNDYFDEALTLNIKKQVNETKKHTEKD